MSCDATHGQKMWAESSAFATFPTIARSALVDILLFPVAKSMTAIPLPSVVQNTLRPSSTTSYFGLLAQSVMFFFAFLIDSSTRLPGILAPLVLWSTEQPASSSSLRHSLL